MPASGYKKCSKCAIEKPTDQFYRRSRSPDGLQAHCKACDNAKKKAWVHANMERHTEFTNRWKKNNPEKQAEIHARSHKKRLEKNPSFAVEAVRRHRERHPEKHHARHTLQRAVREGKIIKPDCCEDCNQFFDDARKLHGHHADYSQPLAVEWLCKDCHAERHRE